MRTLYVGGLTQLASLDALRTKFLEYGALERARLITGGRQDAHRGFAYITYASPADARRAIEALDGCNFLGGQLRVDLA